MSTAATVFYDRLLLRNAATPLEELDQPPPPCTQKKTKQGRQIAPVLDQLAGALPGVRFYKVDIDNADVAKSVASHDVSAVPTFTFYKGKALVDTFTGARVDLLRDLLQKHG